MEYAHIKENRQSFKVDLNTYKCPVCSKITATRGFIQHVKNHFIKRDLVAFYKAGLLSCKTSHKKSLLAYNRQPNKCICCGKAILAGETDRVSNIKQKKFCNHSCSAKYSNLHRTAATHNKVKLTWAKKIGGRCTKTCRLCNKSFYPKSQNQIYCSRLCREKSHGTIDQLNMWVIDFVQHNGYVPTSKMSMKHTHMARKFYGSWNNMIKSLGYHPHLQKYNKGTYLCKDGHISDSVALMLVDNWLFLNNIKHLRRKKYPNSNKDCDFYLVDLDVWVLYFGLLHEDAKYDLTAALKRRLAELNNIKLIGILKLYLFPNNRLNLLFAFA